MFCLSLLRRSWPIEIFGGVRFEVLRTSQKHVRKVTIIPYQLISCSLGFYSCSLGLHSYSLGYSFGLHSCSRGLHSYSLGLHSRSLGFLKICIHLFYIRSLFVLQSSTLVHFGFVLTSCAVASTRLTFVLTSLCIQFHSFYSRSYSFVCRALVLLSSFFVLHSCTFVLVSNEVLTVC